MESPQLIGMIAVILLLGFLASGMWIAVALGLVGIIFLTFFVGHGLVSMIGVLQFNSTNSWLYTAIPLFIFMGELTLYSGLSEKLYKAATAWVGSFPGGLLHTNIVTCAIFAAVSGSSMATAATIGTVAIPELEKRGYDRKLLLGSLAAGGTLGVLIPPSIPLILYGAWVGESIGRLFIAGIFPGLILAALFMTYIGLTSTLRPGFAYPREKFSLKELPSSFALGLPIVILIALVLGTIYAGMATPTEAAAIGAFGALVLCGIYRRLTWQVVKKSALAAIQITAWVQLIVIGASLLSMGLSMLKVPAELTAWVCSLPVSRYVILSLICIFYIGLGCFIDAISMMLLTLPVIYPVIMGLGFDSIWFGIMMVIFIEMGQITPPLGVNLYVIYGITGRKYLKEIVLGSIPFFVCMLILLGVLILAPELALWLPEQMIQRF